jgi:hypothetical protein
MPLVYTVGHGNRTIDDLVAALIAAGVEQGVLRYTRGAAQSELF